VICIPVLSLIVILVNEDVVSVLGGFCTLLTENVKEVLGFISPPDTVRVAVTVEPDLLQDTEVVNVPVEQDTELGKVV